MTDYQTVNEVAKALGVYPGRIYRAHAMGRVAEPTKAGRTRLYTDADIAELKQYFTNNQRLTKECKV